MNGYKRCRVCLVPASTSSLSSLRGSDEGKAMFLEKLFGIGQTNVYQETLVCEKCSAMIDHVYGFISQAKHLDETYFATIGFLSSCGRNEYWPRLCRCCLSALDLCGIADEPDLVPLLQLITGVDVREFQANVLICPKCKELRFASLMNLVVNENLKLHFNKTAQKVAVTKSRSKMEEVESKTEAMKLKKAVEKKSKLIAAKNQCDKCSKSFANAPKLKLPVQNIHEKKNRFYCNFCIFKTRLLRDFLIHIARHLDIAERAKERKLFVAKDESAVSLLCQVCTEDFESVTELTRHYMQMHQAVRKFECDHCSYRSFRKKEMTNHITCKHLLKSLNGQYNEERPFKCTFKDCQKRFKALTGLKEHMNRTHSEIRYPCSWCEKSYVRKHDLKKHQNTCSQQAIP